MSSRCTTRIAILVTVLVAVPFAAAAAARRSPLIEAVIAGDVAAVRSLLPQADVNAAASDGTTPLHWAVHHDHAVLVDLLIKAGANVAAANLYNMTPLGLASINGNGAIIERLLQAGANANSTTNQGEPVLLTAARAGRVDAVKVLLARGANVNARETLSNSQTALMWAAARNNVEVVKALIEAGADVNAKTPLVIRKDRNREGYYSDDPKATFVGREAAKGWSYAAPEPSAYSALMFAIRAGSADAVRVLLEHGANVNETLSDGTSALILAVANGHWELAAFLLDKGANPNANDAGWTALHQAMRTRRPNLGSGSGVDPPGPVGSGTMSSLEFIKYLLAKGAKVNARMLNNGMRDHQRRSMQFMGATAFLLAAKFADLEIMRVLIAHGANPAITNVEGNTALMLAAGVTVNNVGEDPGTAQDDMPERLAVVKYCLELGNDINAVATDLETAMHGAAYLGHVPIAQFLVEHGAKLDVKSLRGWTPLAIAQGVSYTEFFKDTPAVAAYLRQVMTARGLSIENQIADPKVCKDCVQGHPEEAHRRVMRDITLERDEALIRELKRAE